MPDPIEVAQEFARELDRQGADAALKARAEDLTIRTKRRLAELYDADLRSIDQRTYDMAAEVRIPHPLPNVEYADGIIECTHAKKHTKWEYCGITMPD